MIGEHKTWLANNNMRENAKTTKAFVHKRDTSSNKKKIIICWCCREENHFREKCPKKDKAYCKKCKSREHYEKACRDKAAASTSRDYNHKKG